MTRQRLNTDSFRVIRKGSYHLPIVLLLATGTLNAAEDDANGTQAMPNLEFLEFLGSFATEEGEWIDPNSLLEDEFSALLDAYSDRANAATQQTDDLTNQDADND